MSKFYVVFHESKSGQDLIYCDSLLSAKTEAEQITKKYYSDYAKTYKEVCNQGCYDRIYIKSISLRNDLIKKEDLQELFVKMVVNPDQLSIEDNDLNLDNYPNIQKIEKKYGFKMEFGRFSYYTGYRFIDPFNGNCILFTSKYLSETIIECKTLISECPHHTGRFFAIEEKNQYDNSVSLKFLDKFCEIVNTLDLKVSRISGTNKEHKDLFKNEFTILHD